ncbi:hypothetical protein EZS27_019445 [termite gut metagenome]|uniref:SsuA/THI5-like domain-containing protein n=1 Tax=termite gut metagenome TaxID=433724 RepID=A0A5J4RD52_9ZZZZ
MKFLSLLYSALILLSACTSNSTKKASAQLTPVRLGAMSSMDYLPFVVAQKQGIYPSLGLEVNIVKFFSANDRDAAFQSGNVDGTVIDYTGAALQQAGGIGLGIAMKNDGYFYLIAGQKSRIDTISQLTHRNITVSRNTVIEYATDQILAQAGILPEDVNKPEINKIPIRLEMVQNGQIDATILIEDVGIPENLAESVAIPQYTLATIPFPKDIKRTVDWLKAKNLVPDTYTGDTLVVAGYTDL